MKFAKGVVLEIPESIKTPNSRLAQERELWWQDLNKCCSADAEKRPSTLETIRMVCVFNSGLWQPNACVSETDYDGLQAIRAHESCIPSEYIFPLCCIIYCSWNFIRCLWILKGLPFSTKNNSTASTHIANLSGDVIYLKNVEMTPHTDWNDNRLVEVCEGKMDGTSVTLKQPKLSTIVRRGPHVDTISRLKALNNVSALFKYINTSNK